jgi:hypothetical protein
MVVLVRGRAGSGVIAHAGGADHEGHARFAEFRAHFAGILEDLDIGGADGTATLCRLLMDFDGRWGGDTMRWEYDYPIGFLCAMCLGFETDAAPTGTAPAVELVNMGFFELRLHRSRSFGANGQERFVILS